MAASLLSVEPRLAHPWALAPRRVIHAIGLFLQARELDDAPVESVAATLLTAEARELMRIARPNVPARLFQLLDRARLPVWPLDVYIVLDQILRAGLEDVLADKPSISASTVIDLKIALHGHPLLAKTMVHFSRDWNHLHTVLQMIDRMGLLNSLHTAPRKAGPAAVARRIVKDIGQARAPDVAFPALLGWRRIGGLAELWTISERLQLCLKPGRYEAGQHAISFLMGCSVFLFNDEHQQLAQFCPYPGNTWYLAQCKGERNAEPPQELGAELRAAVGAAGIWLLPHDADTALGTILCHLSGLSILIGEKKSATMPTQPERCPPTGTINTGAGDRRLFEPIIDHAAIFTEVTQRNALRKQAMLPLLDVPKEFAWAVAMAEQRRFRETCRSYESERQRIYAEVLGEYVEVRGIPPCTWFSRWLVNNETYRRFCAHLKWAEGIEVPIVEARNTVTYGGGRPGGNEQSEPKPEAAQQHGRNRDFSEILQGLGPAREPEDPAELKQLNAWLKDWGLPSLQERRGRQQTPSAASLEGAPNRSGDEQANPAPGPV